MGKNGKPKVAKKPGRKPAKIKISTITKLINDGVNVRLRDDGMVSVETENGWVDLTSKLKRKLKAALPTPTEPGKDKP